MRVKIEKERWRREIRQTERMKKRRGERERERDGIGAICLIIIIAKIKR